MITEPENTAEVTYIETLHSYRQHLRTQQKDGIKKSGIMFFRRWMMKRRSKHLAPFLDLSKADIYAHLLQLQESYQLNDLECWLDTLNVFPNFPGYPFMLRADFDDHINYVCRYFIEIAGKNLPKIPFIAFQKTASSYISVVLCGLLDIPPTVLSFNHIKGIPSWVNAFGKWGGVTHDHYNPSPENLKLLQDAGIKKCIIHSRHPVNVLISLAFHSIDLDPTIDKKRLGEEGERIMLVRELLDRDMEKIVNGYATWHRRWRNEALSGRIEILETSYEDMKADQLAFFKRILDFYGITCDEPRLIQTLEALKPKKNNKGYNFRKASANEWEEVLTTKQIEKVKQLVGKEYPDRYF